jgi:hypothetical protein
MKDLLIQLSFKQFLKTPFSWLFVAMICALIWIGRMLLNSKENEVNDYRKRVEQCDEESRKDKQLLQDIVFQQNLKKEIDGK